MRAAQHHQRVCLLATAPAAALERYVAEEQAQHDAAGAVAHHRRVGLLGDKEAPKDHDRLSGCAHRGFASLPLLA
jgi:hypothetical protein